MDRFDRFWQMLLIATFVPLSWLGMMIVHELGHVIAAVATGGRVVEVRLPVWGFSSTFIDPNPRPLEVAWGGPAFGIVLPLVPLSFAVAVPAGFRRQGDASGASSCRHRTGILLLQWFAGFCLIANGAYLGVGWIDGVGDAGDLLRHGSAAWQLIAFGALTVPLGLLLWHGTGPAFGLAAAGGRVSRAAAIVSLVVLVVLLVIEVRIAGPLGSL